MHENVGHVQNALEGWVRGMEACKSEQEGQRREKEDQLFAELEGLKAQLEDFERRNAALDGEPLPPAACCLSPSRLSLCERCIVCACASGRDADTMLV